MPAPRPPQLTLTAPSIGPAMRAHAQTQAFPMHGICGIWGVLFVGLLAKEEHIVEVGWAE